MDNKTEKLSIKNWSVDDRPREKMLAKGRESLTDSELIAILIGSGNNDESAVALSQRILNDNSNNLIELSKLSINDLMAYKGIGEAKSITIAAALELGRRRRYAEAIEKPSVGCSRDAFEYLYPHVSDLAHEQFWILLLNSANKIIKKERIGIGGLSSTSADPKIIFKSAIESLASSIILCHNHPSGSTEPSKTDMNLTTNIINGGKVLDIKILDHLIVGNNVYFSFADHGLI